jgi:hypothetical protein
LGFLVDVWFWSALTLTLNQRVREVFCDVRIELISPSIQKESLQRNPVYEGLARESMPSRKAR